MSFPLFLFIIVTRIHTYNSLNTTGLSPFSVIGETGHLWTITSQPSLWFKCLISMPPPPRLWWSWQMRGGEGWLVMRREQTQTHARVLHCSLLPTSLPRRSTAGRRFRLETRSTISHNGDTTGNFHKEWGRWQLCFGELPASVLPLERKGLTDWDTASNFLLHGRQVQ